jgi:hypothetical protein
LEIYGYWQNAQNVLDIKDNDEFFVKFVLTQILNDDVFFPLTPL